MGNLIGMDFQPITDYREMCLKSSLGILDNTFKCFVVCAVIICYAIHQVKTSPRNGGGRSMLKSGGRSVAVKRDEFGHTLLHRVAYHDFSGRVKRIIKKGADVDAQDKAGHTPLHEAAYKGRVKNILALLEAGAKINIRGEDGRTPLDTARGHGTAHCLSSRGAKTGKELDMQKESEVQTKPNQGEVK